jgi:hypothetical protein
MFALQVSLLSVAAVCCVADIVLTVRAIPQHNPNLYHLARLRRYCRAARRVAQEQNRMLRTARV